MKGIRLDPAAYQEGTVFSVTIATADRSPQFRGGTLVGVCTEQLRVSATKYDASVFAYCFMPDHVHLLVTLPPGKSLVTFIRHFKQVTSFCFRKTHAHTRQRLWQRRFYDHALRREEDIEGAANYIWGNPVRAGLVEQAEQYPYSGSLAWDASGSEDPDLRDRDPPSDQAIVGKGLQTLAAAGS